MVTPRKLSRYRNYRNYYRNVRSFCEIKSNQKWPISTKLTIISKCAQTLLNSSLAIMYAQLPFQNGAGNFLVCIIYIFSWIVCRASGYRRPMIISNKTDHFNKAKVSVSCSAFFSFFFFLPGNDIEKNTYSDWLTPVRLTSHVERGGI